MHIEDFVSRVASEPERIATRTVWVTPSEVLAKAARGGLSMTDLVSTPGRQAQQREVRYRHVLGSGAPNEELGAWDHHSSYPLPADLRALVARIDGIHLWASADTGRSYVGLAPIGEWARASARLHGSISSRSAFDDRYVAISYHQDGASFVVIDLASGVYYLMDAAGPDTTSPIAANAGELLDWLWEHRLLPTA